MLSSHILKIYFTEQNTSRYVLAYLFWWIYLVLHEDITVTIQIPKLISRTLSKEKLLWTFLPIQDKITTFANADHYTKIITADLITKITTTAAVVVVVVVVVVSVAINVIIIIIIVVITNVIIIINNNQMPSRCRIWAHLRGVVPKEGFWTT